MLSGISVFNLAVKNYKAAIDFYTKKVGMTLITNEPSIDHYELTIGNSKKPTICLCEGEPLDSDAGIIFSTNDIQATFRELRKSGVQIREPYEAHGEWWSGFRDPDGNAFGIHQESD
jgi:predicted enzyme related to lactoylglutathione lyase